MPLFCSAQDMKKKALVLKFPKEKLRKRKRQGEDDLEYLGKRTKTVHRRDTNPEVPFSAALDKTLIKLRSLPEAAHFQKPVSAKLVPDYYTIIKFPMDLQTIKEVCTSAALHTTPTSMSVSYTHLTLPTKA